MKKRGFTLIEILVVIILIGIISMAIVGLYVFSDKIFKKNESISDVLEEMRSGVATLDFLFSRWGTGVPCQNNTCVINATGISPCDGFPPSDPMCMSCNSGSLTTGCSDIEFFGNLEGMGFVISANPVTGSATIISCGLEYDSDCSKQCYYIWNGSEGISGFSWNSTTGQPIPRCLPSSEYEGECISNPTPITVSFSNSTFPIETGNIIMRAPYKIRIYLDTDGWIKMEKFDPCDNFNSEETKKIARAVDFKVYAVGKSIKVEAKFVSQSNPNKIFKIERYFGR